MKFLDFFKKLFSKKEPEGTEEKRQQIERTLNAKILADIEKEKDARELIAMKRKERLMKEKSKMAKKRNKTLSSNF